jgi:hypothetical protein
MKKLLLILLCLPMIGFAQSVPQGINYQAVARDANGDVLMNQALTIQFSVISDITTSAISWQETHPVTTNDYGLFTAIIGQGTTTSVGSSLTFDSISWGASHHFLKVEIDYGGGLLDMGTTAFMSVPYSMNAKTAETATTASNVDPTDELQSLSISGDTLFISSGNYIILPSSVPNVLGCTDSTALNYNALANIDDGSCNAPFYGAIGDTYQGGIIFYLDGNGAGLIAAPSDQSTAAEWGCDGTATGATGTFIGAGNQNTTDILNGCSQLGIAAYICDTLTLDGYNDWFLPSQDELNKMYLNIGQGNALGLGNVGGFGYFDSYWSSTENNGYWSNSTYIAVPSELAWYKNFNNGNQNPIIKSSNLNVRAIRAFGNLTIYGCTDPTATNYNPSANIDDSSCTYPFTGAIGDTYQGGIVFYILQAGDIGYVSGQVHGLIAATSDQSSVAPWGCYQTLTGSNGTAIGIGNQNTIYIEAGCTTPGTAADICANLSLGGYSDWFLPSKEELNQMYLNIGQGNALGLGNVGGFGNINYWSSTESDQIRAWDQFFGDGNQDSSYKIFTFNVRAVRAF